MIRGHDRTLSSSPLVRAAYWLSVSCSFPRWAVIVFSFLYGLLFISTVLSLFD